MSNYAEARAVTQTTYLTDKQLAARFGVSRATPWRWIGRGFPAPVKLSPGVTRWRLIDVEAWERARTNDPGGAM